MQIFPAGTPQFSVPVVFVVKTFAVWFELDFTTWAYKNPVHETQCFKLEKVNNQVQIDGGGALFDTQKKI